MALSWIYVLFGKVTVVQGLFFGLKAAVLVIVIEAVLRVGRRALKNNTMRALAAAAFIALFFYNVPFPVIIVLAALIGYVGGRANVPAFVAGGGHGKLGDKQVADSESLLGEETPAHARPNLRWSLSITAVFLRSGWCLFALLWFGLGSDNVFPRSPSSSARWRSSPSAALCRAGLRAQQRSRTITGAAGEMLDGLGMAETTPGP